MRTIFKQLTTSILLVILVIFSPNIVAKKHNNDAVNAKKYNYLITKPFRTKPLSTKPFSTKPVIGVASFYSDKFNGKRTASGEKFNNSAMTAAHKTLPFGTHMKVTNMRNKRSVVVRINDRGPHKKGRVIDLTQAAAHKIGFGSRGLAKVKLQILD